MSIGVGAKTRLLLEVLLLAALAAGFLILAESPAAAQQSPTLSLTKIDNPDPVLVGQNLTYILRVTNNGDDTATNVKITDNLPANTTFVSASTNCTYNSGSHTVTCDVGSLTRRRSATRQIVVRPTAAAAGTTITNTATATADNRSPATATATTAVRPEADLSITKTDSPDPVLVGQDLTYTLTVTNAGPNAATNVIITDNLPANTTFVSASTNCTYNSGSHTVTCNLGDLANGGSAQKQIVVRPTAVAAGTTITNTASVSSDTRDPNTANNSASAATTVNPAADLSITKSGPAQATNGQSFDYTLTVTNNGPSDATRVLVTDRLPEGVRFVSASDDCRNNAGTVRCNLGALANGGEVRIVIRVEAKTPGKKINRASVRSDTADSNNQNNSDTTTTVVRPQPAPSANLSLRKNADPEPITVGKKLTYTLTVKNNGPDAATGLVIKDNLPSGVSFVSASKGCNNSRGTVTCEVNRLADGASVTKKIVVRVKKAGELRNTAMVKSGVKDPSPANNADTESTRAKPVPKPLPTAGCEASPGSGKVIKGTRGNDVLRGTPGDDTIFGYGGDDVIYGRGGDDTIVAGAGNDAIAAGGGDDVVCTGSGTNAVHSGGGSDHVFGGSRKDAIYGEGGDDVIDGGGGGSRALSGGGGNDTIRGGGGRDAADGGPGRDKVYGEGRSDALDVSDDARGDLVDGGSGGDACSFDRGDRVKSCP